MKIKELKEKLEANTSEKLFGIDKQPEQNCPKVDKGIKAWYNVQRDIEGYCKDLKRCDTVEEAEKIGGDIDWAIGRLDVSVAQVGIAECKPIKLHRPTSGLQRFKFAVKPLLMLHFVSKRILLQTK